jgi:ribosomal protein L37E
VTLQIEQDRIVALGIQQAVAEAANRLRAFDVSREPLIQGYDSEAARLAIALAMAKLAVKDDISCASTTADSLPPPGTPNSQGGGTPVHESIMQGQVITKMPHPTESFSKNPPAGPSGTKTRTGAYRCDSVARFCFNCGNPLLNGAQNFCAYCGAPTERMRNETQMEPQITPEMEGQYLNYMPEVQPMMQMPMQMMQSATDAMTMMPMPMQFVQAPTQASLLQQHYQGYASASPDGQQTLMVAPACIMPMRMGL